MKQSDIQQLKEGAIIVYVLLPKDRPTNPKFEYRGEIKKVELALKRVVVDILNKGYEGDEEPVFFDQIVRIEQEEKEHRA
jgi:hypothetical protein